MKRALLLTPFLLAGCGGGAAEPTGLAGTWTGQASGLTVTVKVNKEFDNDAGSVVMQGTMSTSRTNCFSNATMVGERTETTVRFLANGSGSESQSTSVEITGELTGGKLVGKLSMIGDFEMADCQIDKADIELSR